MKFERVSIHITNHDEDNALEGTGSETKMQEIDRVTKPENKGGDIQAKAGDCGGEVTKIKQK